jgi:hypothetical protein
MIELSRALGEYRDDVVIVGGWVPELLIPGAGHVGSTDVDLALDHKALEDPGYSTILKKLQERGYEQSEKQPIIFYPSSPESCVIGVLPGLQFRRVQ